MYDIYEVIESTVIDSVFKSFEKLGENVEVIGSHQNGAEPSETYAVINVLNMQRQGLAGRSGMGEFVSGRVNEYISQPYETLVQITFIGSTSGGLGTLFHSQFSSNTPIREIFLRNNLAPRRVSDLRKTPQLRDANKWVKSFTLDVSLGFTVFTVQDVDWADYITVNGKTIPLIK